MAIISFWSGSKKETGQTLAITALATRMAIEHNYRILLIDATFDDGMLDIPRLRTEPITAYIDADAAIELLMEANHKLKLQATITSAKLDYIDMDGMKIDSNNISYE